jgi:hypothetical protein
MAEAVAVALRGVALWIRDLCHVTGGMVRGARKSSTGR